MALTVTLTFNPCIDQSIVVPRFIPDKKIYCPAPRQDPGGGGINVARGIKRLGGEVVAIYPAGGYFGGLLNRFLREEQVPSLPVRIGQETRENWMIFESETNKQYRFIMPGPTLLEEEWNQCLAALESVNEVAFLVVSGSLPPGFPRDIFERIGAIAGRKNARLIVDTSGEALELALKQHVYLVKPNLDELVSLASAFRLNSASAAEAAREMVEKGFAQTVVLSMGAAGAMLFDAAGTTEIKAPPTQKAGSVGAGDSMVAGIVQSLANKKTMREALAWGVACGAAATLNTGTELFHPEDVEKLYRAVAP
jgi:6-phosphofructokinase 2